jgi:hypothetical protein
MSSEFDARRRDVQMHQVVASAKPVSDDQLDTVAGGNVITTTYKRIDGEAAFYAGFCMGLMGF